jgi:Flp pilus assembly protein TadG
VARPRRLLEDRSGNVAAIFAVAAIPALGLVGVAVDYSRATGYRTALQSAADAAVCRRSRRADQEGAEDLAGDVAHEVLARPCPRAKSRTSRPSMPSSRTRRITVTAR